MIYASHASEASKEERQTKILAELFKQNNELSQPGEIADHFWMISCKNQHAYKTFDFESVLDLQKSCKKYYKKLFYSL